MKPPHELTDDELCRAVAVEVMDGMSLYHNPSFKLDWNSTGRVVEAMQAAGFFVVIKTYPAVKKPRFRVRMAQGRDKLDDVVAVSRKSLPRAVFEAALLAKRAAS